MNHIYIHIPFCLKKCAYCAFYSVTDNALVEQFIEALLKEIDEYAEFYGKDEIETIYIGGGTPSILTEKQLSKICERLYLRFRISSPVSTKGGAAFGGGERIRPALSQVEGVRGRHPSVNSPSPRPSPSLDFARDFARGEGGSLEFSIEVNPETVNKEALAGYKKLGVTRLSIGVQSFNDNELKYLGRIHTAAKARETLKSAADIFGNINIDLMFGLPLQTKDAVSFNIKEAAAFSPKHISNYELTFEKGTRIYNDAAKRDDDDPALYNHAKALLEKAGYVQYEISNFAKCCHSCESRNPDALDPRLRGDDKRDWQCRHNLAYWSDKSYLGLGPAAHSYDAVKKIRWANKASVKDYISGDRQDFVEEAQDIDKIITGLRRTSGMEYSSIPKRYETPVLSLIERGFLKKEGNMLALTARGALLSNRVLLEIASYLVEGQQMPPMRYCSSSIDVE